MIDFLLLGVGGACGITIGLSVAAFFNAIIKKPKDFEELARTAPIFAANKLQRQDIHVAISMDRYDEEPEETIRRVKKDFAKEIIRLIDNQIEVTPDYKTRHFVFSVVIWTKEAADENQDQETN